MLVSPRSRHAAALLAAAVALVLFGSWGQPARSADHAVNVGDNFYSPAQIAVAVGETVVWTNSGANTHTVSGPGLDSGVMAPTATYRHTFTKAETVEYRCAFHENMVGHVVVSSGGSTTTTTSRPGSVTTTTHAGNGSGGTTSTSAPAGSANASDSTTTTAAAPVGTGSDTTHTTLAGDDERASGPTRRSPSRDGDSAPAPVKALAVLSLAAVGTALARQVRRPPA